MARWYCGDYGWGLLPVHITGELNGIVVAPPGANKGASAILTNVMDRKNRFQVIYDPGGEITASAYAAWKSYGFDVFVINPWEAHCQAPWNLPSHKFNPLDALDPGASDFVTKAQALAAAMIEVPADTKGNAKFFADEGRALLAALIMHVKTSEPSERQVLGTVREYIGSSPENWEKLIDAMQSSEAGGDAVAEEGNALARRLADEAGSENSGIMSSVKQGTNDLKDPVQTAALSASEVDFGRLKGFRLDGSKVKGCIISIVVPLEYTEVARGLCRQAITQILWSLERKPFAKEKVLGIFDEVHLLGAFEQLHRSLATHRKYNLNQIWVFQSLTQVRMLFPVNWQVVMAQRVQQFLSASGDPETRDYVSKTLGDSTVAITKMRNGLRGEKEKEEQYVRRPVMTGDEVRRLPAGRNITIISRERAVKLRSRPVWERPGLRRRLTLNPFYPSIPPLPRSTPLRIAIGQLTKFFAHLMAPRPLAVAVVMGVLLIAAGAGVLVEERFKGGSWWCRYLTPSGFVEELQSGSQQSSGCDGAYFKALDRQS